MIDYTIVLLNSSVRVNTEHVCVFKHIEFDFKLINVVGVMKGHF